MQPQLIILDRDGVINEDSPDFIKSADEFIPIPGSIAAIAALKQRGHFVAIATNQSGLARGLFTQADFEAIHHKLDRLLAAKHAKVDYLAFCPHDPNDNCACRKPKPGLLQEICQHFHIKPSAAIFIGDSYRDYEAAQALNMPFTLVLSGKGQATLAKYPELKQSIPIYQNLASFVEKAL